MTLHISSHIKSNFRFFFRTRSTLYKTDTNFGPDGGCLSRVFPRPFRHGGICAPPPPSPICSLAHKSNFAGHVIVTTGLRRMHFPRPGFFVRWNSNLQQVDFSQGFASNSILGPVVLAVNYGFLHLHTCVISHIFLCFSVYIFTIWKFKL